MYGLNAKHSTVLLSHQPRVLDFAETENVGLILSGHTHGGQIDLPLIGPPARFATGELKYTQGLFRRGNTQLYVSRGTGVIGLPVRLGVRPEIPVLCLRRAPENTSIINALKPGPQSEPRDLVDPLNPHQCYVIRRRLCNSKCIHLLDASSEQTLCP